MTAAEVIDRLDRAQIANARLNDMNELWHHAQLAARKRWVEVGSPAGNVPAMLPPGLPDTFAPRMDPIPAVGQHTEAILRELGYADATIARLSSERAI
jgi:itaconate CoA-transferase